MRKNGFWDHPPFPETLDLVERDDSITYLNWAWMMMMFQRTTIWMFFVSTTITKRTKNWTKIQTEILESELINMIIECTSQERDFLRYICILWTDQCSILSPSRSMEKLVCLWKLLRINIWLPVSPYTWNTQVAKMSPSHSRTCCTPIPFHGPWSCLSVCYELPIFELVRCR